LAAFVPFVVQSSLSAGAPSVPCTNDLFPSAEADFAAADRI
jgi:hypothetical protein